MLTGGDSATTNNRMEMQSAIAALESLEGPCRIKPHSDSQYLIKGMNEWIEGWKRRDWKGSKNKPVKNPDLWKRFDAVALRHEIEWIWVRGHNNHPENERPDRQSEQARSKSSRVGDAAE